MPGLSLSILGPYSATLDGQPLGAFRTRLAQALFIYLACEPERHRREQLMALFWPGLPQTSAQQNLRQNLYLLRRAIPEVASIAGEGRVPLVLADNDALQLNPEAAVTVDARRFAALIDRIRPRLGKLEETAALYRGDFLADFYLPDSNPFEEWAAARREAYRRGVLLALERLAALHLGDEDYAAAENYARRQLVIDPLHETGHRQLIEILARSGRRSAALAHFDDYRRLLYTELGVKPGSETLALVDAVQGGELLPAGRRPDHIRGYDIHEELGRGSFGVVFRASQPAIGRDVAVKVIPARYADDVAFIRRFEAEAQTIARLEHPQIVPLYDYWREPGSAYLVMRYLRGGNLKASLGGDPWPLDRVTQLLDQLAAALAAAHRHGIVHRDVKPANILLDEDGNAYMTDFGIARLLQPDGAVATTFEAFAGTPEYVSPEQALNEPVTPLSDQYSLALVVYEALSGRPPFAADSLLELLEKQVHEPLPSLHERLPGLPSAVDEVLGRALAKRPADRYPDVVAFAGAFRAAAQGEQVVATPVEPLLVVDNPYKGLLAFTEADAGLFYGREALTQQLIDRLAETGEHHRFLAVVGPSGSGKSSLVRAGFVPAIRAGALPGSEQWFVLDMIPGSHPYEELETALLRIAVNPPASLLEQLQDGERGLLRAVRRTLPPDEGAELVLIIDQFEELFTLVPDRDVTARFLDSLVAAVTDPRSALRVIVTLRADFYDRPLLYPGLSELVQARTEVVVPLSTDELVRAIEQPAARVGVKAEPDLVTALVADVNEQPGALPLLQYSLSELFEGREDGRLTLAAYRQLGGVSGALAQRAEAVYGGLDGAGQTAAHALFSRLVTLGEGVEDTRRRVLRGELEALALSDDRPQTTDHGFQERAGSLATVVRGPSSVVAPLDVFGRARLLAFDRDPVTRGPTVEIAHEALLRAWPRLRGWLDEDRAALRLSRLLTAAAAEWEAAGRADGFLLRGARLDQLAPLAGGAVALTEGERSYLAASLAARETRRAAEEARRQTEIDTAQKLAETERRRADEQAHNAGRLRRRAALLAGALGLALLLAVLAAGFARSSARNAGVAATREAEALANAELAATREAEAVTNAALAATREAEANRAADAQATAEAEAVAQRDLALTREREALESYSLSLAANARQALEADDQPLALLLALAANGVENPPLDSWRTLLDVAYAPGAVRAFPAGSPVNAVAVSPDKRTMLTGTDDGLIRLWDLQSGELLRTLHGHTDEVLSLAFSPDGAKALSGSRDESVISWNLTDGTIEQRLLGHSDPVRALVYLSDGRRALTGEDPGPWPPGRLILWDIATGEIISRFGDDAGVSVEGVRAIAVNPDQRTALVGYGREFPLETESVALWDIETGKLVRFLEGVGQTVNDLAITPDGRLGLGASDDKTVHVWDLLTGEHLLSLTGHEGPVTSVAVSPDGRTALSGELNGSLIWWDLASAEIVQRLGGYNDAVWDIAFLDDSRAVTGSLDMKARLWDLTSGWQTARWREGDDMSCCLSTVEFSADGRFVLAAKSNRGEDNRIVLWDYVSGSPIREITDVPGWVFATAMTPDARQALIATNGGHLILMDLESGEVVRRLASTQSNVNAVDISADGRFALSASVNGQVTYWNLATGEVIHHMTGHLDGRGVSDVEFLAGEHQAISSSADGSLIIWDLESGAQIRRLIGPEIGRSGYATNTLGLGLQLALSADDNSGRVVSVGSDQSLHVWDVETGQAVRLVTGFSDSTQTVALTPDGQQALVGVFNDDIFLVEIDSEKVIRRYPIRDVSSGGWTPIFAVHPNGRSFISDDIDGSMIVWQLHEPSTGELTDWLSTSRATRELTCLERGTYRIEPLCLNGESSQTTAEMINTMRRTTAALGTTTNNAMEPVQTNLPLVFTIPTREPKAAVLGENRGVLARGDFDVWAYEGKAREILSLHMVADNPLTDPALPFEQIYETGVLDTTLFVINPDGSLLFAINDDIATDGTRLSNARVLAVALPEDGTYRIEARSTLDDQAGPYSLYIQHAKTYWDGELFRDYEGYYLDGPWKAEVFFYINENRMMSNIFDLGSKGLEVIPLNETDFVDTGGILIRFKRDEQGQVIGYDGLASYIHPTGGQWFEAVRIGDLPPDFTPP